MNDSKISVRYTKALFSCANEAGIADNVMRDLTCIAEIVRTDDFKYLMQNPVIKTSEKKNIINKLFTAKIEELSLKFIILVIQNKRESYLERIIRNYHGLYRAHKGIISAELIVPVKVDKEIINRFHNILRDFFKAEIEFSEKVKPGILGGFILKIDDEQYDASVSSSIAKMKETLSL